MWKDREEGPECRCGMPTTVYIDKENSPFLMCIFHPGAEGIMWPLPKKKPENWDSLSKEELGKIMQQASEDYFKDEVN